MTFASSIRFTHHARQRMRERKVRERDVRDVVKRGKQKKDGDSVLVQIPEDQVGESPSRRLSGLLELVVVLTSDEECVITAYRTGPEPYRYIPDTRFDFKASEPTFQLGDVVDAQTDDDGSSSEDE